MQKGFSFVEVLVVLAILGFISLLAVSTFGGRDRAAVRAAADQLAAHLEGARADAVAGKFGTAHGVVFGESSYTIFSGASYDEDDDGNVTHELGERVTLSTDLSGGAVVFARMTGAASSAGAVTLSAGEESRVVRIGTRGDVSIEQP